MFLALRGELVDDLGSLAAGRLGLLLGDPAGPQHALEAGVEGAVRDRPERAEQRVQPLAQFVAVHRRLVEEAQSRDLQHAGALGHLSHLPE